MSKWKEIALMALCVLLAFAMLVVLIFMVGEMYGDTYASGALGFDHTVAEMVNRGVV
jgi:hypothetical protein